MDRAYAVVRAFARFWVWFFFKRMGARHPERVPRTGPVLLCINHPNNFIDSLVVGAAVPRKVHYLATAALFRNPLLGRFLLRMGAIPVYRKQDDPDRMDKNASTFDACWRALAEGRLVAIYPEGTTHAEARVQRIKTGAARIALGFEERHPGALTLVPVGLTFEARKAFRGHVLVSFGPPVPVSPYLDAYRADPVKAVDALTDAIQRAMETEVVNVERLDDARLVAAVEELYRDELARELRESRGLAPKDVDPVRLSRGIVDAVRWFKTHDAPRVELLWQRIQAYRALLAEHRLRDEAVRDWRRQRPSRARVRRGWEAVAGFPIFVYGALVNALPYYVPRALARRLARKETDYMTIRLLAGIVAVPLFWGLETWLVARWASAGWTALFALSLPVSGLIAYRYRVGARQFRAGLRMARLGIVHGPARARLVAERQAIVDEIERAKRDYFTATRGSSF
ncbi:MAG: 1-acyl-sn-glycerol-3-phosphate acyltransferase [Candidatus Rokubacteria bacterium]|nr:1-acyl-sn-glycerol-3-phosphate acyltransferase [Candidatus Rokubacteria bacterium]